MAKGKTSSTVKAGGVPIKGATAADKQTIAAAKESVKRETAQRAPARTASPIKRGDETPEAQPTKAAKQAAANKMFKDADAAAMAGLPPDMTVEQNEARVGKAGHGL